MTILNSAVCFIAALAAAVTVVSWLLTFTPWARIMPDAFFVPLFFLTFPLFGWSVFILSVVRRKPGSRRQAADPLKEIPRARVPLALVGAVALASFVTAMPSLTGQPEYDKAKHRYFYSDHGTLIPATRTGYLHAVAAQNRLFLGVALVFLTAAVAITWDERNRRRGFPGPPAGWWHPVRPRPRVPVPGPVLVLSAAAGLAGLIACAILIIGRVDAYNTSGPYLRAGHPVRVLLAPDDYVVFVGCTENIDCPRLAPGALSVTGASGAALDVFADPSNDRLSEAQPFRGELSFVVPRREEAVIALSSYPGQPVFVVPSPGEEARALAGWIALAVLSLVVLIAAMTGTVLLLTWRLGLGKPVLAVPPDQDGLGAA